MGDVVVVLKAMPAQGADLGKLKEEIRKVISAEKNIRIRTIEEKPIAFGLKSLEILFIMPDSGGTGGIEEKIAKIVGIDSVEAGDITLL